MNREAGITVMIAVGFAFTAIAQEKIERSALPPAVEQTVQAVSAGASIRGFSTEREDGKQFYEAQLMVDGHTRDVEIAENGVVNEIEEEVAFDSLPEGVKTSLTVKAGHAKIVKVESLTKHEKLVAYEAATLKGSKKGEIQVGPTGEHLAHEE